MHLTNEQKKAARAIYSYMMSPTRDYIAVAGYAGTGKTTVMGFTAGELLKRRPNASIAFTAPTGKAAEVLRQKLMAAHAFGKNCTSSTLHSLLYEPPEKDGKQLRWTKQKSLDCDVVVVDEASMVNKELFKDVMSFGKPVVFIGDSGQLPPVGEDLFVPLQETGLVLTEVQRQALDNPILSLATDIRNGNPLPAPGTKLGENVLVLAKKSSAGEMIFDKFLRRVGADDCMALCFTNMTRVSINMRARSLLGYEGDLPEPGERVVCLSNDKQARMFNGQTFHVTEAFEHEGMEDLYVIEFDERAYKYLGWSGTYNNSSTRSLNLQDIELPMDISRQMATAGQRRPLSMDYAYCMSVHKSQGSEWDNVMLCDDAGYLQREKPDEYRRWLYTGITRAKNKLIILR
mgnify:CR=1 FL=1